MARISLLTESGVTPLVVFDGGRLPNKADEERSRERSRGENKARARLLWQQGNKVAAMECYQRAVDITPAHAKQLVEVGARVIPQGMLNDGTPYRLNTACTQSAGPETVRHSIYSSTI
jgi:hypothetical protein